ncbi:MAG: hypothetical protein GX608_10350 [Lentisphaerae bacterium]|nr:hypothetical protein [Lentisphaerota bacterium]
MKRQPLPQFPAADRMPASDRIKRLREQTFRYPMMAELPQNSWGPRRRLALGEGWLQSAGQPTARLRRAASQACRLDHEPAVIHDHELIVGCPDLSALTEAEQKRLDEISPMLQAMPLSRGQYDHMALDYEKLLRVGVNGLISEIRQRRKALNPQAPINLAKEEFYTGCLLELEALLRLARRYADQARALAPGAPPERSEELLQIAGILDRVPAQPAATFREALQSLHFYTFMLWGDYQAGRPDQYLIDFYRADVAAGRLTPEGALELIDCFCLLYSAYHPKGSAVGFMVGGRDPAGKAVHNELTYLFIQSIAHTRMAYPGIGLCVHRETPDDLLDLAAHMLSQGTSHPAIFNDDAITQGLMNYGMPERDARSYVHSSCVEITSCGRSGCWVFSPTVNLLTLLLDHMQEEAGCGSLEEFLGKYEQKLRLKLAADIHTQSLWQLERSRNGSDSLLSSCLVNDCLKSGKSVDEGGADYNYIMPTFLGIANLVDSVMAIKTLVYDEKKLTLAEFHGICLGNFENDRVLLERIANRFPHFGNDEAATDSLMRDLSQRIARSCEGLVNFYGSRALPGVYSYMAHVSAGAQTPATPDGRKARASLASAASPAQGRDTRGPTASILSSTCWDQTPFMGGVSVNFTFQPDPALTCANLKAITKTFLARGGLQLQATCVAKETLLDAQKNPARHRDLLVRIGGYSDYFTRISPAMQAEIIARTSHVV